MKAGRQSHAPLDLRSRREKGLKIERITKLSNRIRPIQMLDIGTGSGGISNYFGNNTALQCDVDSVDVADVRMAADGYTFHLIEGTQLPFPDKYFDVVISNHVIEHVGETKEQAHHLKELYRVLKNDGVGYIAVPNRWMLVEPHYKLAFLSWLPRSLRSAYLRAARKGDFYDCEPLEMKKLENLLESVHLKGKNESVQAIRETLEIEHRRSVLSFCLGLVPDKVFELARPVIPTLIYTVTKVGAAHHPT